MKKTPENMHVWSKNYAYFRIFFIIYAFLQESNATKLMGKKFISSDEKAIKKFQTLLALGDYKDVKTQTKNCFAGEYGRNCEVTKSTFVQKEKAIIELILRCKRRTK